MDNDNGWDSIPAETSHGNLHVVTHTGGVSQLCEKKLGFTASYVYLIWSFSDRACCFQPPSCLLCSALGRSAQQSCRLVVNESVARLQLKCRTSHDRNRLQPADARRHTVRALFTILHQSQSQDIKEYISLGVGEEG